MVLSFGTNADVSESIWRSIQDLSYESYNKQWSKASSRLDRPSGRPLGFV